MTTHVVQGSEFAIERFRKFCSCRYDDFDLAVQEVDGHHYATVNLPFGKRYVMAMLRDDHHGLTYVDTTETTA